MRGSGFSVTAIAAARFHVRFRFHREPDAIAFEIDLHDRDLDFLSDLDDFRGILDEMVGELADVDESVLVNADIDKSTEGRDIRDDAGEFHSDLEVRRFFDAVLEREQFELFTWVAAWFCEFGKDVLERGESDVSADVFLEVDGFASGLIG